MIDNAVFEGQRNSFAPMTMSRNLFQCTQTWGQTHHRLGISQALGQLSSKYFWQNQGQRAGCRAHHGRKKGLQHLFHLLTYLLNDLIAQEEILPSLHTHWRSLLLGRGKQETATRKANVHNHIFFWGHSLLILGIFRNQRNSVCRYLINLNNCSHFKINIGIVIGVWFSKIWYRPLRQHFQKNI